MHGCLHRHSDTSSNLLTVETANPVPTKWKLERGAADRQQRQWLPCQQAEQVPNSAWGRFLNSTSGPANAHGETERCAWGKTTRQAVSSTKKAIFPISLEAAVATLSEAGSASAGSRKSPPVACQSWTPPFPVGSENTHDLLLKSVNNRQKGE